MWGNVCTAVRTDVGKHVQQYVQVWGNICMYNSMYKYGEMFVCTTGCTNVGKHLYVQVWGKPVCTTVRTGVGKTCTYNSMYSVGKLFRMLPSCTRLCEPEGF